MTETMQYDPIWPFPDLECDADAEKAMDRIAQANRNVRKWEAFYEQQLAVIRQQAQQEIAYQTELLRRYFDSLPEEVRHATKTQTSYQLPSGKLMMKHPGPEYIRDDAALLAWCQANAKDCVKVEYKPDWGKLKKRCLPGTACLAETGEVVPGVEVRQREDVFVVDTGEGSV